MLHDPANYIRPIEGRLIGQIIYPLKYCLMFILLLKFTGLFK